MKKDSTKGIHLMLIITALMVMLLALEIYYQGKDDMREANTVATHELEEANLSIMNTMMDIEESVKAVSQLAWTRADSPEAMAAITESLLNTGNQIVASCVSFEPYTFKEYGRLLQVYSHMKDGKVEAGGRLLERPLYRRRGQKLAHRFVRDAHPRRQPPHHRHTQRGHHARLDGALAGRNKALPQLGVHAADAQGNAHSRHPD